MPTVVCRLALSIQSRSLIRSQYTGAAHSLTQASFTSFSIMSENNHTAAASSTAHSSTTTSAPPPPTSSSLSSASPLLPFSGYFKRSIPERQSLLLPHLPPTYDSTHLSSLLTSNLTPAAASHMIENAIGILSLPLAVAPTFVINHRHYIVPMCVEEPSVVAAASGIGKLVSEEGGGFSVETTDDVMIGQVQLLDVRSEEVDACVALIGERKAELVRQANMFCPSMVKRGGGVLNVTAERREARTADRTATIVLFVRVNVCNSMGANIVNTICEGLSPYLTALLAPHQPRIGLRILSNLCTDRRAAASFRLPFTSLAYKGVAGSEVARRIVEAYNFALDDEYRAVTNNKGVMNGMDAVAVATGQDWRALEAAAHAWAAVRWRFDDRYVKANYGPLAQYWIEGEQLVGRCDIPISVGTVGGALSAHPVYSFALSLLGQPTAQQLAGVIVSVGLAQNFAAIRALAIEGIQKGHMSLHARNIVRGAAVDESLVEEVVSYVVACGRVNARQCVDFVTQRRVWQQPPSSLYVEVIGVDGVDGGVLRSVVLFDASETGVVRLLLTGDGATTELQDELMGRKGGKWVSDGLTAVQTERAGEVELLRRVKAAVESGEGKEHAVGAALLVGLQKRLQELSNDSGVNGVNSVTDQVRDAKL